MIQLYKIGEISKACNISIKTLRYYEDMGLIKPREVDIYTGYRYYDDENVQTVYKIQLLKELGFSLAEIKEFDEDSLKNKFSNIEKEISELKKKLDMISYLNIQKGEKIMKPFINDEKAIGKWKYNCSTESFARYSKGETYIDKDILFKELYFLPNGEGYWVFEGWSKGVIYHFRGNYYKYSIVDNKLFVEISNEEQECLHTLVYDKVNSKEYTEDEIKIKDDVDLPFELYEKAIGSWTAIDYISIKDKFNYVPKIKDDLFLKSLSLMPNGDCFRESSKGEINKIKWTKDFILGDITASNFIIQEIEGEEYLIMDWKSGDYVFGGEIFGCYVFKKEK